MKAVSAARRSSDVDPAPDEWWDALTAEILGCLAEAGRLSPAEVGRRLGMSEDGARSCLAMLAERGEVHICLVERAQPPAR